VCVGRRWRFSFILSTFRCSPLCFSFFFCSLSLFILLLSFLFFFSYFVCTLQACDLSSVFIFSLFLLLSIYYLFYLIIYFLFYSLALFFLSYFVLHPCNFVFTVFFLTAMFLFLRCSLKLVVRFVCSGNFQLPINQEAGWWILCYILKEVCINFYWHSSGMRVTEANSNWLSIAWEGWKTNPMCLVTHTRFGPASGYSGN
jgi:hypothetical protein